MTEISVTPLANSSYKIEFAAGVDPATRFVVKTEFEEAFGKPQS